jgi:hypothetical protein
MKRFMPNPAKEKKDFFGNEVRHCDLYYRTSYMRGYIFNKDKPALPAQVREFKPYTVYTTKGGAYFIGPFDKDDRTTVKKLIEAYRLKLLGGVKTIGIYMIDIKAATPSRIFIDNNKGWACNIMRFLGASTGDYPFNNMCLAAAERPAKSDNLASFQKGTDSLTKGQSFIRRV